MDTSEQSQQQRQTPGAAPSLAKPSRAMLPQREPATRIALAEAPATAPTMPATRPRSAPGSPSGIWRILALLGSAVLAAALVVSVSAAHNQQQSLHASDGPADVTMVSGPKPAPSGKNSGLWTQCARISITNHHDVPVSWSGHLALVGGTVASVVTPNSVAALELAESDNSDSSSSSETFYKVTPRAGTDTTILPGGSIDSVVEFCVNYKTAWKVRPVIQLAPAGSELLAVQADPAHNLKRLVKRDAVFQADWSAGYCRCLNVARELVTSQTETAGPTTRATETGGGAGPTTTSEAAPTTSDTSAPTTSDVVVNTNTVAPEPTTTVAPAPVPPPPAPVVEEPTTTVAPVPPPPPPAPVPAPAPATTVAPAPVPPPPAAIAQPTTVAQVPDTPPSPPPPPAVPTTTVPAIIRTSTSATQSITIAAVYTSPVTLPPNTTVYVPSDLRNITNFGQTLSDCLTAVNRNSSFGWAVYLPGPMACFGSEDLFFEAVPGTNAKKIDDGGSGSQAYRKKSYSTYTTATATRTTTKTLTTSRTATTTTTCRPMGQTCNFDYECCYHSSGGTTSQTGGSVCFDSGSGVKTCSGPKCSSADFSQCGLCLDNCGTSNKIAVCTSFNQTLGSTKCSNVNGNQGGGRCPGTAVCCFVVPSVASDSYGNCPLTL